MKLKWSKNWSIRWRFFFALEGFTIFVFMLLWLFQVIFLESIYTRIKIGEIEDCAENLPTQSLQALQSQLVEYTYDKQICGVIYSPPLLDEIYASHTDSLCSLTLIRHSRLTEIYQNTKESKDFYLLRYISNENSDPDTKTEQETNENQGDNRPRKMLDLDCMIASKIVSLENGESYLVVLDSVLTPVSSTIDTIISEYLFICVILIIFSAFLAFLMSIHITAPIRDITQKAWKLAGGQYAEDFTPKHSFGELDELADTLNFLANELKRTETLRRELIANVSHDLKTPLTLISGYSEVMRDLPGENTPENLQIIIDETDRLTLLVNDLLDISKLESGIISLQKTRFSITALVDEILERYAKLKEQDGYKIHFDRTCEVYVYADRLKISQVIYNLVNNAINYTGESKEVWIRQLIVGNQVRIEVEDNGKGITKEEISSIWERYYRSDTDHARAPVGTGLGLSITKKCWSCTAPLSVSTAPPESAVHFGLCSLLSKRNIRFEMTVTCGHFFLVYIGIDKSTKQKYKAG